MLVVLVFRIKWTLITSGSIFIVGALLIGFYALHSNNEALLKQCAHVGLTGVTLTGAYILVSRWIKRTVIRALIEPRSGVFARPARLTLLLESHLWSEDERHHRTKNWFNENPHEAVEWYLEDLKTP